MPPRAFRELVLIRHAKSSRDDPALDDFDRPLNARGKRDAPEMGERLRLQGCIPDLILCSPAKRARKTARPIAEALGYPKEKVDLDARLYLLGAEELGSLVREVPDERRRVFLVGHNPDITEFAEWLSGENLGNIPTCGVVALRMNVPAWRAIGANTGTLLFFDYPKKPRSGESGVSSAS
ncbi:MAG TPA: histidine phosphatase family protein [Methylococcaceae bacterium]|nr:histidine phosphatase family protein [Methylococcaceae bacterium]